MYIITGVQNPFFKAIATLADDAILFKDQVVTTTITGTDITAANTSTVFEVKFAFRDGKNFIGISFRTPTGDRGMVKIDTNWADASELLGLLYRISTSLRTGPVECRYFPNVHEEYSKAATINSIENGIILDIA